MNDEGRQCLARTRLDPFKHSPGLRERRTVPGFPLAKKENGGPLSRGGRVRGLNARRTQRAQEPPLFWCKALYCGAARPPRAPVPAQVAGTAAEMLRTGRRPSGTASKDDTGPTVGLSCDYSCAFVASVPACPHVGASLPPAVHSWRLRLSSMTLCAQRSVNRKSSRRVEGLQVGLGATVRGTGNLPPGLPSKPRQTGTVVHGRLQTGLRSAQPTGRR
jgi:hypothetical protein